jgi:hypothetical protein
VFYAFNCSNWYERQGKKRRKEKENEKKGEEKVMGRETLRRL